MLENPGKETCTTKLHLWVDSLLMGDTLVLDITKVVWTLPYMSTLRRYTTQA